MRKLAVLLVVGLVAGTVGASTVTYTIDPSATSGSGTFDLYMEVTDTGGPTTSYGIAAFSVVITGGDFTANTSPKPYWYQATPPFTGIYGGYSLVRTQTASNVAGAQDKADVAGDGSVNLMFGVGQSSIDWSVASNYDDPVAAPYTTFYMEAGDTTHGAQVKIAEGTFDNFADLDFDTGVDTYASVWTVDAKDGLATPSANADNLEFVIIPEPATMGLLAIGGIAALIRRRR